MLVPYLTVLDLKPETSASLNQKERTHPIPTMQKDQSLSPKLMGKIPDSGMRMLHGLSYSDRNVFKNKLFFAS